MPFDQQERIDGVLLSLAGSLEGGVPELFDHIFSFLSRKTDFYTGASVDAARQIVNQAFEKYAADAKKVFKFEKNCILKVNCENYIGSRTEEIAQRS